MKIQTKNEALSFLKGEPQATAHDRKECGCFDGYEERLDLFKRGILWLQERGLSDPGLAILSERSDELGHAWCEASLEEFTDFWRGVVKEVGETV